MDIKRDEDSEYDRIMRSLCPLKIERLSKLGAFEKSTRTSRTRKLKRAIKKLDMQIVSELKIRNARPIFNLVQLDAIEKPSLREQQLGPVNKLADDVLWKARFSKSTAVNYELPLPSKELVQIPLEAIDD
jgi:hypothetical protein